MRWYRKYSPVYEKPYQQAPGNVFDEIKEKVDRINQTEAPLVSVVAIAHNEEKHLLGCLWSICDNITEFPFELLVVDNASTDGTAALLKRLNVRRTEETRKGPGFARQRGLEEARGKYHLCIDADTLYPPHYIQTMTSRLMTGKPAAVFGLWSFIPDDRHPRAGLFFYELLRDIHLRIQYIKRPELCVRGMSFGFPTRTARQYGFRTDILRGEDGSLALNLKKEGKIEFLTGRKVRVYTGNSTLNAEGSLFANFKSRLLKALKMNKFLYTEQNIYHDDDSNLIK